MTHQEFFQAVKQRVFARVYLFVGEEEHVKQRALATLRQAALPEGLEAFNETVLDNPTASDILAAAETLPMMADRRLIIVKGSALLTSGRAKDEAADSALLAEALPKLPDTACVVFFCHGMHDGRKKLSQALARFADVVKFDPLGDAELAQWMRGTIKPYNKTISPQNAALLAFTCGRDLRVLTQELSKLAAFEPDTPEITEAHITRMATPSLESTVFQFVDAVTAGQEPQAFALLANMLEMGESRIGILAMVTRQFRHLFHIQLMLQDGVRTDDIQRQIGIPPFAMKRALSQVKQFAGKALQTNVELCVETDYAIKSGRMREEEALLRAVLLLCGSVKAGENAR